MRTSRSRRCAGALLAVVAATLLLPVVALARVPAAAARHGCSCPVKMACCEAGLCRGEADRSPASGAAWSGCHDEGRGRDALLAPSTALDSALLPAPDAPVPEARSMAAFVAPGAVDAPRFAPVTPPPRRFAASR